MAEVEDSRQAGALSQIETKVTPAMIVAGSSALRACNYEFWESMDDAACGALVCRVFQAMSASKNGGV